MVFSLSLKCAPFTPTPAAAKAPLSLPREADPKRPFNVEVVFALMDGHSARQLIRYW
jgi:hypothetical protein